MTLRSATIILGSDHRVRPVVRKLTPLSMQRVGGGSRSFFPGLERVWRAEVGSGTVMGFAPLFSKFNPLKKQAMLAFSMGEMPCFSCRQWLPGQRVASRNTDITQDAAFHGPLETKESIS